MELTNEFTVDVPVKEAWVVLTDVERIAPCMPGAELTEVEGDEYRGMVKVKVGPITSQYKGKAAFLERDEGNYKAVLKAEGRETRGQGNASATITATLVPEGERTKVRVVTDLTITGRAAQFGRGVLADVSTKLLGQFVSCLEQKVLGADGGDAEPAPATTGAGAGPAASTAGGTTAPAGASDAAGAATTSGSNGSPAGAGSDTTGVAASAPVAENLRRFEPASAEPVDLLGTAGLPVAKRLAPVVAALAAVLLLLRRRGRRRRARAGAGDDS